MIQTISKNQRSSSSALRPEKVSIHRPYTSHFHSLILLRLSFISCRLLEWTAAIFHHCSPLCIKTRWYNKCLFKPVHLEFLGSLLEFLQAGTGANALFGVANDNFGPKGQLHIDEVISYMTHCICSPNNRLDLLKAFPIDIRLSWSWSNISSKSVLMTCGICWYAIWLVHAFLLSSPP